MENREDLLGVLQVLYRWRKPILFTTMAAALLSIVIALILPKYYQSATTFYAASPDLNKPDIVFGDINTNFDYYGSDADIDRILTIAQSNELVDYMVDSFRLYEAYDIDPDNSKAPHYVELNFQKLYNVIRTPFDAILLEIEDKDPALSARMVEAARGKINEIATGLIRSSQQNQILLFESNMRDQEAALAIIEDSLSNISRTYGIINSESQSEVLSTLITQARANLERSRAQLRSLSDQPGSYQDSLTLISSRIRGYEQELRSLIRGQVDGAANFRSFSDGISKFENLRTRHEQLSRNQSELVEKLSKLKNAYLSSVPAIHVIEHAKVPVIKSRPVRSLLVTSATIAAFIFSILGALVFDYYKKIDWNSIKRS